MNILTNLKNISRTFIALATLSVTLTACSKDDDDITPPQISGVSVIHASPTTEKLDFYVENVKANNEDFAYTDKIDYLNLYSGTRRLVIAKKGGTTALLTEDFPLEPQKGYSLFVCDKFETIKFLMIKDDLTAPASGKARVRFVHMSPDAPALNLAIAGKDTDLFTDKSFKGYTDFVDIDPAEKVTFNVKNKDGGAIAASIADVEIKADKIYTVWVKGLKAATDDTKLGVEVFMHK
ncbi:MAG TPA: DUF4397 domain-containing protein [Pedobacter sp.]|uniref:DUF4397 domain-containing protein n=1 Tax=Pedobacter sp. TaxID=1411316 RepID=UPI002CF57B1E|nr:DUF4397 domain-containing protein [Pedobacter sp.]HMI00986.1 DUF4397 domain-containing protein [Pedobacter sp.]